MEKIIYNRIVGGFNQFNSSGITFRELVNVMYEIILYYGQSEIGGNISKEKQLDNVVNNIALLSDKTCLTYKWMLHNNGSYIGYLDGYRFAFKEHLNETHVIFDIRYNFTDGVWDIEFNEFVS